MKDSIKTKTFKLKAKDVHGDKYDYSLAKYKGCHKKIRIICKTHGVFEQIASYHLQGGGCNYCARNRLTEEQFLEKVNKIHKNKYDYSKTNYSPQTKRFDTLTIICPEHGEFYQRNDSHQGGKGCPKCGRINRAKSKAKKSVNLKQKQQAPLTGNYFLKVRYGLKNNPVEIELISNSFENRVEAEKHLEEVEMFLDIIKGKIIESKVDVLSVIKKPETVDEYHNKSSLLKKSIVMPKFMRALFSYFLA